LRAPSKSGVSDDSADGGIGPIAKKAAPAPPAKAQPTSAALANPPVVDSFVEEEEELEPYPPARPSARPALSDARDGHQASKKGPAAHAEEEEEEEEPEPRSQQSSKKVDDDAAMTELKKRYAAGSVGSEDDDDFDINAMAQNLGIDFNESDGED
jgi:hypothetical protein